MLMSKDTEYTDVTMGQEVFLEKPPFYAFMKTWFYKKTLFKQVTNSLFNFISYDGFNEPDGGEMRRNSVINWTALAHPEFTQDPDEFIPATLLSHLYPQVSEFGPAYKEMKVAGHFINILLGYVDSSKKFMSMVTDGNFFNRRAYVTAIRSVAAVLLIDPPLARLSQEQRESFGWFDYSWETQLRRTYHDPRTSAPGAVRIEGVFLALTAAHLVGTKVSVHGQRFEYTKRHHKMLLRVYTKAQKKYPEYYARAAAGK
jgi:hypothetical protein